LYLRGLAFKPYIAPRGQPEKYSVLRGVDSSA
jgi:hypothetical protein